MSAYRDKDQWVVFKFPDGNIYKLSPQVVDIVPPSKETLPEGHSTEVHQDMVQLGNEYLQLLLESDEPYENIKEWMIASLRQLFGEEEEE